MDREQTEDYFTGEKDPPGRHDHVQHDLQAEEGRCHQIPLIMTLALMLLTKSVYKAFNEIIRK